MKNLIISLGVLASLAACSSGSSPVAKAPVQAPDPVVVPANVLSSSADPTFTATVSEDGETIQVVIDGDEKELQVTDFYSNDAFTFAHAQKGDQNFFASVAENDATRVGYMSNGNEFDPDTMERRLFVQRLDETTLPLSGTGEFSGSYAGIIENAALISGDAQLTANFDNSTISGAITDRVIEDGAGNIAMILSDDLVLQSTSIDASGAFAGTTAGGNMELGTDSLVAQEGSFQGLITGKNGDQLGGGIIQDYDLDGTALREVGVFIAD